MILRCIFGIEDVNSELLCYECVTISQCHSTFSDSTCHVDFPRLPSRLNPHHRCEKLRARRAAPARLVLNYSKFLSLFFSSRDKRYSERKSSPCSIVSLRREEGWEGEIVAHLRRRRNIQYKPFRFFHELNNFRPFYSTNSLFIG